MSPISSRRIVPPCVLELPVSLTVRAGERALLVPEEFAFEQVSRDGGAVEAG